MFLLTLKPIACWAWEIQYFLYKTEPRIISLHILISAGQGGGSKQEQHFFFNILPFCFLALFERAWFSLIPAVELSTGEIHTKGYVTLTLGHYSMPDTL
jgi:hypothetical protein